VRESTEVHAARENERTELTKAKATHFTSAYCSAALEWPHHQGRRTGPPERTLESTRSGGMRTPTGHSRKPCGLGYALSGTGRYRRPYAGFLFHCYSNPLPVYRLLENQTERQTV
jgi:hypothetical protein